MTLATLALLIHLQRQDLENISQLEKKLILPEIRIERMAIQAYKVGLFSWLYLPPTGVH